ncbi:PepSY-associated TM helix domain-containing protein [Roseococcus sp. YIM B11640]|uniref:PepSY-associated TM helix domain-containing protein n=1 Tax=Roseococcus sp. YIM B11640 TaxID=3133973 RepID=UPI003C7BE96E
MNPSKSGTVRPPLATGNRSFWLKQLHQWHWISSAICLIGMLLFAATGITLNHAGRIEASPQTSVRTGTMPPALIEGLPRIERDTRAPLPPAMVEWIAREFGVTAGGREAEWSADDIYLPLPRPGGDAWISIDRETGEARHEVTTRGWVSYLNDLHKGRNTGSAWSLFLDVFAVACFVFCLTGLFLLHMHAGARPATWPMVGLGLVVPLVLAILFIH